MIVPPGSGGGKRSGSRPPGKGGRPKSDTGPASVDRDFIGSSPRDVRPPRTPRSGDESVIEAIEIAGLRAEQAVIPFRRDRSRAPVAGTSMVEVVFLDAATFRSFLRVRAVVRSQVLGTWLLIRRWSRPDNDADLDEAMCSIVAGSINADFSRLIRANVLTLLN